MRLISRLGRLYGMLGAMILMTYSGKIVIPAKAATKPLGQPQSWRNVADPNAASTGDVIVSATQGVYVYSSTLKLVAQIDVQDYFGRPAGLALDAAGDLYVANSGTSGIPVYKNDYRTQIATLSAPNGSQGIAVAANGVVGVIAGTQVSFYASGSTTPCESLTIQNAHSLFQGAFDASGNLYVTGQDLNYHGLIGVIRGGCSATGLTPLPTTNILGDYLYGIQVTRFGKIAVGDQINRAIYTYNAPVDGVLGQPITTTALPATTRAIYQFGFTSKGAFVFVPNDSNVVAKYRYPGGGNPLQSFGQKQLSDPTGLVVAPPAQP